MTNESGHNFDLICRLCTAKIVAESEDIFSENGDTLKKIKICLQMKIEENDKLPKCICKSCALKLDEYYSYRESCLQTEMYLLSCLTDTTITSSMVDASDENQLVIQNGKKEMESNVSDSDVSQGDNIDNATSEEDFDYDDKGSSVVSGNRQNGKSKLPELEEPSPDDYVLMKEETFTLDPVKEMNRAATTSILADYLIEFSNSKQLEGIEMKDRDIVECQKLRREVLPPMWDVYEKTSLDKQDAGGENKNVTVIHRRYIINKGAFPCSLCGECFEFDQGKRRDDLSEEKAKLYDCPTCGKLFPRRSSWKRHQNTHEDVKPFVCRVCNKGFNRKEHLSRHLLSHTSERPYSCTVCNKQFIRKEHLTRHQLCNPSCATTVDTVVRPFCCDVCSQGFVRKEHLHRHRKRAHDLDPPDGELEPKPFTCQICTKTFTRREHLKRHQMIHQRDFAMSCISSSKFRNNEITVFATSSFLPEVTLSELNHENESDHFIGGDDFQLGTNLDVENMSEVHYKQEEMETDDIPDDSADEPLPPIPVLEMAPPDESTQQQAVDITKSNTFCNVCFKNFSRRSHLLRHMKRIHRMQLPPMSRKKQQQQRLPGDENGNSLNSDAAAAATATPKYSCSHCGRAFSRKSHLERHEKIHQNARDGPQPYECVTCGETFLQSKLLDKHMEVHGNTVSNNFVWM